ncbi:DUF1772-domain-containing protein [Lindgomyces ingoldianus]|uniref:DUF1772-domain-containing protein n=1 Tax=Lindgomyces ingoldianus TaxID=673940 RepID=A0ACB6QCT3_9PLEO|nr:DUF1772-domain-containing protein [Lindgomyces ingoldianus]KAF2464731.1 DUF1772-domain-containing protein [Lindgomyces ingoldianus]
MSTSNIQATAIITGGFLSGAMMSLCFITVPTILDTATEATHLQKQWARMYHYGHYILPTMAVGTGLLHGYTSLSKSRAQLPWRLFALAGVTVVSIAPFTWIFMLTTNNELFRLGAQPLVPEMSRVRGLVVKWTWLHFARSLLTLTGTIMAAMGTF